MASDWLDANSKSKSIEKALNIKQMIGYPDEYDDPVYINKTRNVIEYIRMFERPLRIG